MARSRRRYRRSPRGSSQSTQFKLELERARLQRQRELLDVERSLYANSTRQIRATLGIALLLAPLAVGAGLRYGVRAGMMVAGIGIVIVLVLFEFMDRRRTEVDRRGKGLRLRRLNLSVGGARLDAGRGSQDWTWQERVGTSYEFEVGQCYREIGYDVEYCGAKLGKHDDGIDLDCRRGSLRVLVQCKCHSRDRIVDADTIRRFARAIERFNDANENQGRPVKGAVWTTSRLSLDAIATAHGLGIRFVESSRSAPYRNIKRACYSK